MTPEQWQQAKRVLAGALERAPGERGVYLDQACTDPALRREVESLITAHENGDASFIDRPATNAPILQNDGRLGHYEIVGRIGSGGMGEVYRGHDMKLKRDVAIKVLPRAFAKDPERLARFGREARLLAALNHAGIASIYGLEDSGETHALVMELVEGPTLADLIRQRAMPLAEALPIAKQICDALEYAHERGIVHRDLKPANIKIAGDEVVKVLDFGLAKAVQGEAGEAQMANSPTISQMATEAGVLLGTAAYMSPEQAKGRAVDRRADIWAFGCVLYEMVTRQRAFGGESISETLAAVLNTEPDWSRLPAGTPMRVRLLLQRCLKKDPKQRLRDIGDARIALDEVISGAPDPALAAITRSAGNRWRHALPWVVMAMASMAALVLAFILIVTASAPPVSGPLIWTQLTFSTEHKYGPIITDGTRLYFQSQGGPVEMSVNGGPMAPLRASISGMSMLDILPDGSELLALKRDLNDETFRGSLWSVPVLGGYPRMLGSQIARGAQWSPDGRSMVYADLNSVYVGDADGAKVRKIWDAPGEVYDPRFSPDSRRICVTVIENEKAARIWQLNADGGSPHRLDLDWPEDADQRHGQWTPDGKHFFFLSTGQVHIYDVYELIHPAWFAFWKKPFAVRLSEGQINVLAATPSRDGAAVFTVGETPQGAMQKWDPAQKRFTPFLGGLAAAEFVISPDRRWMVYVDYPQHHLWRSRLDGSEKFQLTDFYSVMPRWSPDSKKIVFSDWNQVYMIAADGGVAESLIPNPNQEVWPAWSPDGKSILFNDYPIPGQFIGIKILDLATRKITVMPGSEDLYMPTWSPDGRYMVAWGHNPARLMLYSAGDRSWKVLRDFDRSFIWLWSNDSRFLYLLNNADAGPEQVPGIYRLAVPDGAWSRIATYDSANVMGSAAQGVFPSVTDDGQPAMMIDTSVDQIYSANWK